MTSASGSEFAARALHPGEAAGKLLVLDAPLSLWGGVDETGRVVDARHPQYGAELAGRVLAMPATKGSSSSTSVLAEQIRTGIAPAAVLLASADPMVVLGALVAAELYDVALPVLLLEPHLHRQLPRRGHAVVSAGAEEAVLRLAHAISD